MPFIQHSTTLKALLVKARALNNALCGMDPAHPKTRLLDVEYTALQEQIRTLQTSVNQQTWL